MLIEVLVFEGCPHADLALALVTEVAARLVPGTPVSRIDVDTPEKAAEVRFLGSPSVRINGEDIEQRSTDSGSLCCRTYDGEGVPPEWMVETAILRAMPRHGILFLCVANSARSQMAEGIARSIGSAHIRIESAGSHPTRVRPEAIAVMGEIGIDISGHRSKAVSDIGAAGIDTVITLCGEEECPIFPGKVKRLHWGLPDPGASKFLSDTDLEFAGVLELLFQQGGHASPVVDILPGDHQSLNFWRACWFLRLLCQKRNEQYQPHHSEQCSFHLCAPLRNPIFDLITTFSGRKHKKRQASAKWRFMHEILGLRATES